jgi:hypothetical protein
MSRALLARLVIALALLLALATAPMAGALPMERPQVFHSSMDGWIGSVLSWLEGLAGFRRPNPGPHDRSGPQGQQKLTVYPTGGSCIDPQGNPRCG